MFAQHGSAFQPAQGWQAQLLLTLPFFDGGSRGGVAAERDALESEARLQLESALRQVKNEVRTSFEVLLRTDETLAAARDAARLAREAADLARLAYRAGATTNLEVIDAERRARDAETDAALAEDGARPPGSAGRAARRGPLPLRSSVPLVGGRIGASVSRGEVKIPECIAGSRSRFWRSPVPPEAAGRSMEDSST